MPADWCDANFSRGTRLPLPVSHGVERSRSSIRFQRVPSAVDADLPLGRMRPHQARLQHFAPFHGVEVVLFCAGVLASHLLDGGRWKDARKNSFHSPYISLLEDTNPSCRVEFGGCGPGEDPYVYSG